ncbi:MAG: HlyC/CorC family transporter [Firmicutes bacterium]|nr:HlyC/CorC family transporter [Bacillota bacterium]
MLGSIILLIVLIFINGILSSSEIAYLSIDKFDLKEKKKNNKQAKKISKMLENEGSFLSTIQVGITLAGFLSSAFASDTFATYLIEKGVTIINADATRSILVVIITIILSYFTLVFGELVPKKIGRSNPYKVASLTVDLLRIISFIFYPLIKFLTFSTNIVCKLFRIKEKEDSLSEEDIKRIILTGTSEKIIEAKERDYILNIFEFNDKTVKEIMTPKKDCVIINIEDDLKENIKKIKDTKYTRFPVKNKNGIIGFINVKDFILNHQKDKEITIAELLQPVQTFKSTEKIDDVFRKMQKKHHSFGIVKEKGNFIGIITMEDAIEEIVGNIYDEYD